MRWSLAIRETVPIINWLKVRWNRQNLFKWKKSNVGLIDRFHQGIVNSMVLDMVLVTAMALLKDSWPIWPVPCHHKSEEKGEQSIIGEHSVLISENRWSMTLSGSRAGAQGAWWHMVHKETANQFDLLPIVTHPGASVIMCYTHWEGEALKRVKYCFSD